MDKFHVRRNVPAQVSNVTQTLQCLYSIKAVFLVLFWGFEIIFDVNYIFLFTCSSNTFRKYCKVAKVNRSEASEIQYLWYMPYHVSPDMHFRLLRDLVRPRDQSLKWLMVRSTSRYVAILPGLVVTDNVVVTLWLEPVKVNCRRAE